MSETAAPAQNSAVLKPPSYSGLVLAVFVSFIYSIFSTAAYAVLNYPET
ncbi:MAG: hypothetical protein GX410_03480, partial [Elusimicrobia bacterium]|nr:hypothetical protein [Elusimicrobiota bacterium]